MGAANGSEDIASNLLGAQMGDAIDGRGICAYVVWVWLRRWPLY